MKVPMQAWYDEWRKAPNNWNRRYVPTDPKDGPSLPQVHFMRDYLSSVVWADIPYAQRPYGPPPRDDCKETCFVIGEHHSKSVVLPVYSFERPDLGIQFILRDNYHDTNISVISERPISASTLRGYSLDFSESDKKRFKDEPWQRGQSWGYCFFQGFPEEVQFGPYSQDQSKFSICLGGEYSVYTFVWLIMREIREVRGVSP